MSDMKRERRELVKRISAGLIASFLLDSFLLFQFFGIRDLYMNLICSALFVLPTTVIIAFLVEGLREIFRKFMR